jgi:hypothetical protein
MPYSLLLEAVAAATTTPQTIFRGTSPFSGSYSIKKTASKTFFRDDLSLKTNL